MLEKAVDATLRLADMVIGSNITSLLLEETLLVYL
jgi:hypothetical protein